MTAIRIHTLYLPLAVPLLVLPILIRAEEPAATQEDSIQHHQNEELRLKKIIAERDTIVLGTVDSIEPRGPDWNKFDQRKWKITIKIDEVLKGKPIENGKVSIYVHSPAKEFSVDSPENVIKGRRCVWALTLKDGVVFAAEPPFPLQVFDDKVVEHLRALIKEGENAKP